MDDRNFYQILNVDDNSSIDEIKRQYRLLALKHHPDRESGDDALFKRINEAYETLSNEDKRREYNRTLYQYEDMHTRDTLNTLFRDMLSRTEEQQRIIVKMSLDDILYGCYKKYSTRHRAVCAGCRGVGIENPDKNTIQCRECFGKGTNPTMRFMACLTCNGKGIFVIHNRPCRACQGSGSIINTQNRSIYLKPGTADKEIVNVSNTILLFVEHSFSPTEYNFVLLDNTLHFTIRLSLLELLMGFEKQVEIGHERMSLYTSHAFDFTNPMVIKNDGLMDFVLHFDLAFDKDNVDFYSKLSKSLREIRGVSHLEPSENKEFSQLKLINIHKYVDNDKNE